MSTPERRPAAILFAELRNFTRLSEALQPAKVLQLANEFFSLAALSMASHGGKVVGVHNDALLGAFTGSKPEDFCGRAAEAALLLQRDFPAVGDKWQTEFGLPAAVSGGLHMGEAVFGLAGQPGAQHPIAFGDCVSVAERLVHRARAGEIVISREVMKGLGPAVRVLNAMQLPALEIGGKREPVQIYGIVLERRLDFT